MKAKKPLALLLAVVLTLSALAGCGKNGNNTPGNDTPGGDTENTATYTYTDSVVTLASNWNPHVYQTVDDAYPMDTGGISSSLYNYIFNDELHPVEGKDPYDGYAIVPEMAADFPVDVTEQVKASHPQFNIPESATSGYAWSVKLRDDLVWDDGTPITPQDFVDSLERLLRPELINYRASDYYDGTYAIANAREYALSGQPAFQSFAEMGTTYDEFIAEHGAEEVYVNMSDFWGVTAATKLGFAPITDDTMVRDPAVEEGEDEDYVSAKYLFDTYLAPGGSYNDYINDLCGTTYFPYEAGYSFDNVGLFVSGDNELTFVFRNALDGFYLMIYGMSTGFLVKTDLYDSCLSETETASGSVWSSTYCTSVDTTPSYGPYKMDAYQNGKSMHFVKNDKWFGYSDGNHIYVDPTDGQTYDMYQTTDIDCQVIKEAATRKQMFLSGKLMSYGLQAEDFDQYRNSEFTHVTPAETIFFLLFNGYESVINQRENADDFDKATTDLQMQMNNTFRRAVAVSIDRELLAATVSPSRTGGYGFLGDTYVYDPDTAAYYRDTDQAKEALCRFYSVDVDSYGGDLDAAVDSITGFDPETAKELFQQAYEEGIEAGYITDADNDGVCDQTITMVYAISQVSETVDKLIDFLHESFDKVTEGTPLYQKIRIVQSAPLDNDWSKGIQQGLYDTQLAGWSGSVIDPFAMADTWTRSDRAYWGAWWDASTHDLTLNIEGKDITMSLRDWAECLNGTMKTVDGVDYNFTYGQVDVEVRLEILAAIEEQMLLSYNAVPVLQDGGMAMLSQQAYYVVEDYVPMMGRGGISYLKYNYTDAEWADYVASQGGTLQY